MAFYYLNVLSLLFLGGLYAIAILLFWLVWTRVLGWAFRGPVVWTVIPAILIAPWMEEFWIAYHFGQACKDAGTYVFHKVAVDGYYDGTSRGTMTRLVGRPGYKFIESSQGDGKFRRVEYASAQEKASALAWYAQNNSGRLPGPREWITHRITDRMKVTVEMDTGYAWRIIEITKPTARYHYESPYPYGLSVAYKTVKTQAIVIDTETNQQLARYTSFGREPPWFWIGLDIPSFACDAPGRWPLTSGSTLIDREALTPTGQQ